MSATEAERQALARLATSWRVSCDDDQTRAMFAYCELLLRWNARINLTGARSMTALLSEQLPDAFALARRLPPRASVIDVGTGGGLPAIPMALLRPDLDVTLCEPVSKKAAFLRTAIRNLNIGDRVRLRQARVQAVVTETPAAFDVAVSRATFPPAEWIRLGAGLVRSGGEVFALATPESQISGAFVQTDVYLDDRRTLVKVTVSGCAS